MRKLAIIVGALFISVNAIATTTNIPQNIGSEIMKAVQHKAKIAVVKTYPLIYGGQDISRPIIATANESIWAGQGTTLVG